jgi:hypothetical protein
MLEHLFRSESASLAIGLDRLPRNESAIYNTARDTALHVPRCA